MQAKYPENHVIATARTPSEAQGLSQLVNSSPKGRINIVKLDVLDPASINAAVAEVSKILPEGLDAFVSNAGIDSQPKVNFENL